MRVSKETPVLRINLPSLSQVLPFGMHSWDQRVHLLSPVGCVLRRAALPGALSPANQMGFFSFPALKQKRPQLTEDEMHGDDSRELASLVTVEPLATHSLFAELPMELVVVILRHATMAVRLSLCFSVSNCFRQLSQSSAFDELFSKVKLLDCLPGCARYRTAISHSHVDPKYVVACCDVAAWPRIIAKCFGSRLLSLDISPECNHDLPLSPLKKLLRSAPRLSRLRTAYIKNLNSAFVREVAKQLPNIEWLDLNAGGMQKGLGPDGETTLILLAATCRHLKFLRIMPATHFRLSESINHLVVALPDACMLTNNGWMNALCPAPGWPRGFGSPPVDDVPEWHDYGHEPTATNNPRMTYYLQRTTQLDYSESFAKQLPVVWHKTIEAWRAAGVDDVLEAWR